MYIPQKWSTVGIEEKTKDKGVGGGRGGMRQRE